MDLLKTFEEFIYRCKLKFTQRYKIHVQLMWTNKIPYTNTVCKVDNYCKLKLSISSEETFKKLCSYIVEYLKEMCWCKELLLL
jgi:hypothetical protein